MNHPIYDENEDVTQTMEGPPRATWSEYFIDIARQVSTRATCSRLKVGAVFVVDKRIVATGYNGSLSGLPHCDDVGHDMEDGHCVDGGTIISKFQTGKYSHGHRTIEQIYEQWQVPNKRGAMVRMKVRSMAPDGSLVPGSITDVWRVGAKPTVRIRTRLGREVTVTPDHRLFTPHGWQRAEELGVGSEIALNGQPAHEDIVWLVEQYRAGVTAQKLAALTGISRQKIRKRLLAAGVELRPYNGGWNRGLRRDPRCGYKGTEVLPHVARQRSSRWASSVVCSVCGCSDGSNGRVEVHHLDENVWNDADSNLVALCAECHRVAHTPHAKLKRIKFDKVTEIRSAGKRVVYDMTVEPFANFVGDGVVLHNCVRVEHAERNGVAMAARFGIRLEGSTLYCTAFPCWPCFRLVAQAGVRRLVYDTAYRPDQRVVSASEDVGVEVLSLGEAVKLELELPP